MDVPARIVTGYQGADPQLQDGWMVVRNSHAHAWAEVWIEGRGWVRVDPTAAVAPDRIQQARSLRPRPGLVAGAVQSINPALLAQWRAAWESVNNRWNQWVLNYSRNEQFDLLRRLGWQSPQWGDLANLLVLLLSGGALAGAAWAWWDRHRRDPWQRLSQRVAKALAGLGVTAPLHEGARGWARHVRLRLGARGEPVAGALEALDAMRHGRDAPSRPRHDWWAHFRAAVAQARAGAASLPAPASASTPASR
jgi:protein-glutamine gamma-glutamyltransferase